MEEKPLSEIQQKIIRISSKKFAKNGYQKTSLSDIAKSVKIAKELYFIIILVKKNFFS